MASIKLEQVGKRYGYEWIFQTLTYTFEHPHRYAILGANGSGKSTLFQILAGSLLPSLGNIQYTIQNKPILGNEFYQYFTWVAPYIALVEDFTLKEMLLFQAKLKPFLPTYSLPTMMDCMGLTKVADREIRFFSSGMKQRVKLALALFADVPILFLDEPTTNLDQQGIDWYKELITTIAKNKLILIASNQAHEYDFCDKKLHIESFKK